MTPPSPSSEGNGANAGPDLSYLGSGPQGHVQGTSRLSWHVPDNLRWLAQQHDRPGRVPCGMLTGQFLIHVADELERRTQPSPREEGAEQRAREALAREYDRTTAPNRSEMADLVRSGKLDPRGLHAAAIRAMLAFAAPHPTVPVHGVRREAIAQAIALIDEVNLRAPSRQFNGIGHVLHAKLCTIRATLARALIASPTPDDGGEI